MFTKLVDKDFLVAHITFLFNLRPAFSNYWLGWQGLLNRSQVNLPLSPTHVWAQIFRIPRTVDDRRIPTIWLTSRHFKTSTWFQNPRAFPAASFSSDVILFTTACSSSWVSNFIFFKPRPALKRISFSTDDGVLDAALSAKQTNVGVHGLPFPALLVAPLELLAWTRTWLRLLCLRGLKIKCRSPTKTLTKNWILIWRETRASH